jgi:hypothetical protein
MTNSAKSIKRTTTSFNPKLTYTTIIRVTIEKLI